MTTPEKRLILVTGANGFIGSHLLRRIRAEAGLAVRGLVRSSSSLARLAGENFDLAVSSLPGEPGEALRGVDTVVHAAALTSDWGPPEAFFRSNLEGTICLLEAAAAAGVRRFVHISSVAVYGFGGCRDLDEDAPPNPFPNGYCLSKAAAEKEVRTRSGRLETVILRPANVYGPHDHTTTLPLLRALEKGMPFFPGGGKTLTSPCYVGNLAEAVLRALEAGGRRGEAYNVTDGRDMPWAEFLALAAAAMGRRGPRFSLPCLPLYLLGGMLEGIYRLAGSTTPPLITRYRIAQVRRDYGFSIARARRDLGYRPPFTPEEGMAESVRWFKHRA